MDVLVAIVVGLVLPMALVVWLVWRFVRLKSAEAPDRPDS